MPLRDVDAAIRLVRGQHVVLDSDLARLYGVETKALVRAVKRNADRFPSDFVFQLSRDEFADLRCQSGTSSTWGGRRYPPYAFTEHGALMAASVLRSQQADEISVFVVRAFVRMRRLVAEWKTAGPLAESKAARLSSDRLALARKLDEIERRISRQDASIAALFNAVRQLMRLPVETRRPIGF